jgi:diguanylate cyclase (GGDEF)-like protein
MHETVQLQLHDAVITDSGKYRGMPERYVRLSRVLPLALVFAALEEVCSVVPALNTPAVSYTFKIIAGLSAVLACIWRGRRVTGRARVLWAFLAAGLASWSFGMMLSAWEELVEHVSFDYASICDFAFFFYGVPILFALSMPVEGMRSPVFRWLDGIQAAFAGYLAYVTIFSALPFTGIPVSPLPTRLVALTYNVENLMLAACCILRLIASPREGSEERFYRTLSLFLVSYGVCSAIFNHDSILTHGNTRSSLLADAPFLLLTILILTIPAQRSATAASSYSGKKHSRNALVLFVDNASPILFTLALLALGMIVLRTYFALGIVGISVALLVYAVRTTILQMRYRESQLELQEARDRLEEISLRDALTGIANRRCFDQMLETEWRRAMRTRFPLSMLLIDLDYFKNINDHFGHPQGDRALVAVAKALRSVVTRSGDLVARYGGEEFAVILPETTRERAEELALRMQLAVSELQIENPSSLGPYLSISIGATLYLFPEEGSPSLLIEASDRALYRAKEGGRNRIAHASMQELDARVGRQAG